MGKLILNSKKQAELLKQQQNKKSGIPYFKPTYKKKKTSSGSIIEVAEIFICPPKDENSLIVTKIQMHEAFSKKGKMTDSLVSPLNFDEKCEIQQVGFDLYNKFKDTEKEIYKTLAGFALTKEKNIIFVIDPNDVEKGIQMWQAPASVAKFLLEHIEGEDEDSGGDMSFCHPETGKLLKVIKKGEGFNTKYSVKFSETKLDLGEINEDNLSDMLAKLPTLINIEDPSKGLFKKPKKEEVEAYKEWFEDYCSTKGITISWKNTKNSKLDADDESDSDDDDSSTDVDDEELDLEGDDNKKKNNKKNDKKSKPAKNDDEDETETEEEVEEEVDLDADDE